jgi:hypothetical protein
MDSTKQEQHISEREFDFLTIVSNVTCYCNQSSFNKTVHKWHASRIKFVAATYCVKNASRFMYQRAMYTHFKIKVRIFSLNNRFNNRKSI